MGQPTGLQSTAPWRDPSVPGRPAVDAGRFGERHAEDLLHELLRRSGAARATRTRTRGPLDAVASTADETEPAVALRRLVEAGCALVDAECGALLLTDPDRSTTELVTVGLDAETAARIGRRPSGHGLLRLLADTDGPSRADDIATHPSGRGLPPGHPSIVTFLGGPVSWRGRTLGALYLGRKRGGATFTADDEAVAAALATTIALTVEGAASYAESRRRQDWLTASSEITGAVLSVTSPDDALALVARRARQVTEADLAMVVLPSSADGDRLVVQFADGFGAEALRGRTVPADCPHYVDALATGRSVLVVNGGERWVSAGGTTGSGLADGTPVARAIGPAMILPLVAAGHGLGALVVAATRGRPAFSPLELEMATAFAGHAALALHTVRAQRERERLAVFADRDRIARDLHDVVIQRVFATGLQLATLTRAVGGEAADKLASAIGELDRAMDDIRRTIFALQAPPPGGPTLRDHIVDIAARAADWLGVEPDVRVEGPIDQAVPEPIHAHLLAALRETLSNIARHARATRIHLLVRVSCDTLVMQVRDNGCGPGRASRTSGLANLRARARDLGGDMEFGPGRDGTGTTVTWSVPLG